MSIEVAAVMAELKSVRESLYCSFTGSFPENFAGREADTYRKQLNAAYRRIGALIEALDREAKP